VKKQIPTPVLIAILAVVVIVLGIWGYNALIPAGDKTYVNPGGPIGSAPGPQMPMQPPIPPPTGN